MKRIRVSDGGSQAVSVSTGDSLENFITGMGLQGDKNYGTQWIARFLDRNQLNAAYRGDWVARKIVDIPADDATREWRSWQAESTDITALEELERSLKIKQKVKQADRRGSLYGGAALVLGVDRGMPDQPLIADQVRQGDLKFVHVVSRWDLTAGPIEQDLLNPMYGKPQYYTSNGSQTGVPMKIHPTRIVPFIGSEHPDPINSDGQGWGDPVLQIVADAVKACSTVSQSVASLISELQIDIVKVPGMTDRLKTAEYERRLKKRFGLAATAKSIYKILLLDKDEEWERINANLSGMEALIKVYLLIACGAADIPATRFLSQSPQGLNATGDSDIRNYYDKVKARQTNEYDPAMELFNEVLIRSALGDRPEEIFYEWNPLWQMDEKQQAELEKSKAETFNIDVQSGVIEPAIMRAARLNQLIESGNYPGLEQIVEDLEEEDFLTAEQPDEDDDDPTEPPDDGEEGEAESEEEVLKDGKRKRKRVRATWQGERYRPRDGRGLKTAGRYAPTKVQRLPTGIQRFLLGDSALTPRSLYVHRKVVNANDIRKHFKAQGFGNMVPAKEMHVTVIYSQTKVDWGKVGFEGFGGDENGKLIIKPGGMRALERFKKGAIVLCFVSTDLQWRHGDIKSSTECEWEWPDYQPHITLSYEEGKEINVAKLIPYTGKIVLGPEIWEEATEGWSGRLIEDALAESRE